MSARIGRWSLLVGICAASMASLSTMNAIAQNRTVDGQHLVDPEEGSSEKAALDIGSRRELFVDDYLIDRLDGD